MLLFCADEKNFSCRWIDEQFIQVHIHERMLVEVVGFSRDRTGFLGGRCTAGCHQQTNDI